jgi:hypothetical protein
LRVASHEFADAADHQVVGAGVGVHPTRLSERGADAVDEDDVPDFTGHWSLLLDRGPASAPPGGTADRQLTGTDVYVGCY